MVNYFNLSKFVPEINDSDIYNYIAWPEDDGNASDFPAMQKIAGNPSLWYESGKIQILFYSVIFLLAISGNTLVIATLVQNQRMRTVTNLFLLNLAISDLLLGVLCMPFTLVGALLRDFIFGELMCKLLPFLQACAVSVGVWTLVAISVERYYAICHPLRSLRWQTISHAYRLIVAIWLGSVLCMSPIVVLSRLKPTNQGKHKCREDWPSLEYEKAYNLMLDVLLFVIPLLVLAITYSLITRTLCKGIRSESSTSDRHCTESTEVEQDRHISDSSGVTSIEICVDVDGERKWWTRRPQRLTLRQLKMATWSLEMTTETTTETTSSPPPRLRHSHVERTLRNKKHVVKMLLAVVLEFFVCWTPLYVINTIVLFDASVVYAQLGYTAISFLQLLAYTSSCCNPITYCFMSHAFRKAFAKSFRFLGRADHRHHCHRRRTDDWLTASEFNMMDHVSTRSLPNRCHTKTDDIVE